MIDVNNDASKKIVDIYVSANKNKNIIRLIDDKGDEYSKAECCVLSCLDALARYSEYSNEKISWDLNKVIRMIILDSFDDDSFFRNSKNAKIRNLLEEKNKCNTIEALAAKVSQLFIDNRAFEHNQIIKDFIFKYNKLHTITRRGHLLWGANAKRLENDFEHIYGCLVYTLALENETSFFLDYDKLYLLELLHETDEIEFGDNTVFDKHMDREEYLIRFEKCLEEVFGALKLGEKYKSYPRSYEKKDFSSVETYYLYCIDKLEYDHQVKMYDLKGCYEFDKRPKNNCTESNSVKEIIENGADNVFDVHYEFDKEKYNSCPLLRRVLDDIKKL